MSNTQQHAYEIVEELRAEIDFEIDDVIAQIVRGLPDDYFRMLSHADQLEHLKALLALGVSKIKQEITLRSDDDRIIAVVARQNYPGLLAKILKRLPNPTELVGAKIFTSKDHEFIIDLFEFNSPATDPQSEKMNDYDFEQHVHALSQHIERPPAELQHFVSQYNSNSPVFDDIDQLAAQFNAFTNVSETDDIAIKLESIAKKSAHRLTIASRGARAFEVFQKTADYLAEHSHDIEQAVLNDFKCPQGKRVSISSFRLPGDANLEEADCFAKLRSIVE